MLYTYRARVSRVVDGDTIDLEAIDLGFGVTLHGTGSPLRVRLAHCNAYETRLGKNTTLAQREKGRAAKAWLANLIEGQTIRLHTVGSGEQGAFGRWLAWIWLDGPDDHILDIGTSINMDVINKGFGVPYEGR